MERMKENGTYEIFKLKMKLRYHEKIKNNKEEMNKRNLYYKNWYIKNKEKVQEKRRNYYINNPSKFKKKYIPTKKKIEPIIKISRQSFILRFD